MRNNDKGNYIWTKNIIMTMLIYIPYIQWELPWKILSGFPGFPNGKTFMEFLFCIFDVIGQRYATRCINSPHRADLVTCGRVN